MQMNPPTGEEVPAMFSTTYATTSVSSLRPWMLPDASGIAESAELVSRVRRHPVAPIRGTDQGIAMHTVAGTCADFARRPLMTRATDDNFWDPDAWSPPF